MTKKEIAKRYYEWLEEDASEGTARKIIQNLDSLTYGDKGRPIEESEKKEIIAELGKLAKSEQILEHADNSALMELIHIITVAAENNGKDKKQQ